MRTPWLVLFLPLGFVACDDETDHTFTGGISGGPGFVQTNPDGTFIRTSSDGEVLDAQAEAGADAEPGADVAVVADAAVDRGPDTAIPMCTRSDECTRAVLLDACDACPVPMTREALRRRRCAAEFVPGQAFSVYEPARCREDCAPDTLEFCDGRIFPVRCNDDGDCENIR